MRKAFHTVLLLAVILTAGACDFISGIIHDDEVVASVGKNKLYRAELAELIPDGISAEDSTNLALQYINTWATELLFNEVALSQLSKSELDVSRELEDYRHSLLKYRYEQRYINERLDTVVTRAEIEDYFETHREQFELDVPIVRARFLDIMQDSPNLELMRTRMSSEEVGDLEQVDSLAYSSALRYEDLSERWTDMVSFARYFGTDYGTLLARMDKEGYIVLPDERGDVKIAYICEMIKPGQEAPLDYLQDRISDIIISGRKHALIAGLERELLEDALSRNDFEIY